MVIRNPRFKIYIQYPFLIFNDDLLGVFVVKRVSPFYLNQSTIKYYETSILHYSPGDDYYLLPGRGIWGNWFTRIVLNGHANKTNWVYWGDVSSHLVNLHHLQRKKRMVSW